MRNSDPRVNIVFVDRLNFNSHCKFSLYVAGCDFKTGPILVFPRIQPFGSDDFSSLGKVYSRQATANCENSSVSFVMKYCPTSTVVRNPASIQIFITRSGCGSLSTRSLYFCNKFSCAGISIEGLGVIVRIVCWREQWIRLVRTSLPV